MQFIVFGIEQMNPGMGPVETADLFLQGDELIPLLRIAGNRDVSDRKFNSPLRFDRCGDDGVVAEDLFDLVGIGGHAYQCGHCDHNEDWGIRK
jgi:hypothetical protein